MVFSSLLFIYAFLPAALVLYYILPGIKIRNSVLAFISLVFYAWGEPIWVVLLIFSSFYDYIFGKIIDRYRGGFKARAAITASVVLNIGILVLFKYSGLLVESLNAVLGTDMPVPGIRLPIGISFYTFQTLSYSIDVYKGKARVQESFFDFLLFVSLFSQLVAGPILRYSDISEQIKDRKHGITIFSEGVQRFAIGLGKKVIIANHAGELAGQLLPASGAFGSTFGTWLGLLMFTVQIYFDFSGYSDMAIGLGKMFGFSFKENFNYPYISTSISEFWKRWHISLSSWFLDYIYAPVSGKLVKRRWKLKPVYIVSSVIVWALTGIWHGASWNFALWGLYYCALLVLEKLLLLPVLSRIPKPVSWVYTMFLTMIGWCLFYFTDFSQLRLALITLFSVPVAWADAASAQILANNSVFIAVAAIAATDVPRRIVNAVKSGRKGIFSRGWATVAGAALTCGYLLLLLLISTSLLSASSFNPFLYFRF